LIPSLFTLPQLTCRSRRLNNVTGFYISMTRFRDPHARLGASRGAGSAPGESTRGSATVSIARAPPAIHGSRPCGHAGSGIDHPDVTNGRRRVIHL
jgi:hypothetical protein